MAITTWDGSSSTDWSTAANWDTGAVPTDADDAIIPDTTSIQNCHLTADVSCKSLEIKNGATFDMDGNNITLKGKNANNRMIDLGSTITAATWDGTVSFIPDAASGTFRIHTGTNATQTLGDVVVNKTGTTMQLRTAFKCSSLTITAGTFDTYSTLDNALTVTGATDVAGTLTLNGSTCSFGDGGYTGHYGLRATGASGIITADADSTVAMSSLYAADNAGINIALSGTNTINKYRASNNMMIRLTNNTVDSDMTLTVTTTEADKLMQVADANVTLILNASSGTPARKIADSAMSLKALTITNGTLDTDSSNDYALTVTEDIHIDGTLTGNTSTISGRSVHIDGTFTHDGALTCTGIASTNYAFQNLGTWTPGTSQTTTFSGDGATTYHVKSDDWNNVILNAAGENFYFRPETGTAIAFAGDITVTDGNFYQNSAGDTWTVTGHVTINGGSLGLSTPATGTLTFKSLTIGGSGIFRAPNGLTEITGEADTGYAVDNSGTFTANGGTLEVGYASNSFIKLGSSVNNLTIRAENSVVKWVDNTTIAGDVVVTEGVFQPFNNSFTIAVTGDVTIQDGGTLGVIDSAQAYSFGSLTIDSGGRYIATSGTTTLLGNFTDNGTFTHNDGTVSTAAGTAILLLGSSNTAFYDIKSASTGSGVSTFKQYTNKTVEHDMITGSKELQWQLNTNDVVLTLGTTGYASQIDADYFDGTVVANQYVQSASESYPAVFKSTIQFLRFTGHTGQATYMPTNAHIKWVDIQKAVTTPGDTKTITLGGKCEFDGVSVSNGDTIAVDTHELEFSGAFDGDGTVTVSTGQIVGTSNDYRPAVTTITDNAYIQAGDQLGSAFTITASKYPVLKGKRLYTGGGVDFSSSDFRNSSIIINGTETNYLVGDNFNNILVNNASGIETQLGGARTIKGSLRVGGIGKFDTQNNTLDIEGDIRQMKGSTLEFGNSTVRCTGSANFIGGFIGDSLLTFDGTDDKCSSTAAAANFAAIDSSNNFTCEGWIKASSASNYEHILSRGTSWGTGNITVYMNSAGNIQASLNADGSSTNTLTSDSSGLADNRWHHFAYTYDQTNLKLYINGRLEASAAFTTAISASSTGFELGTRGGTTNTWFGGEMARISIWSSALTAVQIRKMMFENFATATTTNCLAWWQMDERFGDTLDDEVGSVDLTVSDTAMWNSPEGSFDDGGSTFTMKGNNTYLWFSPDQTFYNLGLAPGSKTTNISGRSNNNAIKVANTLTLGGGTLTQTPQSVELHLDSTGTPITQDATTSLAQIYRTMFNGAGATITAGTYDFIYPNAANQKLGGNVTGSSCLVSNNASLDLNAKQLSLSTKLELNDNSTLTLNNGAELLFTGGSSEFDSNATSILSAGPSAIINGVSTKSTFKSQNNFSVVGNVANLNVTNEELKVTGMVTNCTGFIHQMNPSQDADQQLDKDTADDRDTQFASLDIDRNTELVG
jgi:hypothetical protein